MKGKKRDCARVVADPMEKVNPQVIRQLIYEIVELEFAGDRGVAANELKLVNKVKGSDRAFTKDSLANIIDDRTAIKYIHLEAIAARFKVPTFMVLLFTRIKSEQEKSPGKRAGEVSEVQHLIRFLKEIDNVIEDCEFTAHDFKNWCNIYSEGRLPL